MHRVLTLIANPARPVLDDSIVMAVRAALESRGAAVETVDFLAPGIACDLPFARLLPTEAEVAARGVIGLAPVDIAAQGQAGRRKRLLACDMDSTLIENEIVDEIAAVAGLRQKIAPITARSVAGEIDFVTSLAERVALLKGLSQTRYLAAGEAIRFVPGARALMATMRAFGAHTMIISGGFRAFTAHVRDALAMDQDVANDVEILGGALTGRLVPPLVARESKAEILRMTATSLGISLAETMAVGDGANDLAMVQAAGLGVAFHGTPRIREGAAVRIDHGDLTALLYLQGYRTAEIRG